MSEVPVKTKLLADDLTADSRVIKGTEIVQTEDGLNVVRFTITPWSDQLYNVAYEKASQAIGIVNCGVDTNKVITLTFRADQGEYDRLTLALRWRRDVQTWINRFLGEPADTPVKEDEPVPVSASPAPRPNRGNSQDTRSTRIWSSYSSTFRPPQTRRR